MTVSHPEQQLASVVIPEEILADVAARAHSIDTGKQTTRDLLSTLTAIGLADLAVAPSDTGLVDQAAVLEALAANSLSVAFSLWCHRMCLEYLTLASSEATQPLLASLRTADRVGSSALAPAFKYLAGHDDLGLYLRRDAEGQLKLSGHLGWATNLFDDAVIFAAAHGPAEAPDPVIVAFPVTAPGVQRGPELELLALRGTASTSVTLNEVTINNDQILTQDLGNFLTRARPVLSLLQASFCLGVATESYRQTRIQLPDVPQVIASEFDDLTDRLVRVKQQFVELAPAVGSKYPPTADDILATRLEAGVLAKELTRVETLIAGSRAFVITSDVNRRYREATFIPLQAPSELQLRSELANSSASVSHQHLPN